MKRAARRPGFVNASRKACSAPPSMRRSSRFGDGSASAAPRWKQESRKAGAAMKRYVGCLVVLLGGCGNPPLDLGSQDGGQPVAGKPGPTSESCENGPQLPIVGTWEGYIENYSFISGSDAIRVTVTNANDTLICGTVVLGNPTTPPPVTDGNTAYPPGRFDPPNLLTGWDGTGLLLVYAEGFILPIEN